MTSPREGRRHADGARRFRWGRLASSAWVPVVSTALALLFGACADTISGPGDGERPGQGVARPDRPNVGGDAPPRTGTDREPRDSAASPSASNPPAPSGAAEGSAAPGGLTGTAPDVSAGPGGSATPPGPSAAPSAAPSSSTPGVSAPAGECSPGDRRPCHGQGAPEEFPECNRGTEPCDAAGNWTGRCEDWTDPALEPCASESTVCTAGVSEACHGAGALDDFPACNHGTRTCVSGAWGPCIGWSMPADNPCGGQPGCEGVTWERALVPNENTVSAIWTGSFVGLLQAWGLQVTRAAFIRIDGVEAADVVVTDASSGISLEDHPERLVAWMEAGGILVLTGAVLQGTNCRVGNGILEETGLRFADCDVAARRGPVASFPGHPITDGLPDRDWPHTEGASVVTFGARGAEIVVRNTEGFGLLGAQRIGCGGLVVISGKDLIATTNTVQFRAHWNNILDWGSGRR